MLVCRLRRARLAAALAWVGLAAPAGAQQPATTAGTPNDVARLDAALQALVLRIKPAVVQVLSTGYGAPVGASEAALLPRQTSAGSGVVLDPAGYIVTNAHVVHGARRIQVLLPPDPAQGASVLKSRGRSIPARVIGVDRESDLAVLQVDEAGLPSLKLADSEAVRQGQLVLALGSPLGLEDSVSLGVVSAAARQLEPESPMIYVQTDASINKGNSGGPLVDTSGRVVGINTMILSQSGGAEGVGFAVPSNIVAAVYNQLREGGRVRRGQIGARAQTITPLLARGLGLSRDRGVVVADVRKDGPARRAGLGVGDIVLSIDGKPLENARQLDVNVYRRTPGTSVSLVVQRGDGVETLVVGVEERPEDKARLLDFVSPERNVVPRLGLLALDLDDVVRGMVGPLRAQAGVVVAASQSDALPFQDALESGDVIYALNGTAVGDIAALRAALDALPAGSAAVLQVERAGALRFVALLLD